jgi:hypothetical protein
MRLSEQLYFGKNVPQTKSSSISKAGSQACFDRVNREHLLTTCGWPLPLVAGMVNIIGVLAMNTLTTNVTGHFAFFAEKFVESEYHQAAIFIAYLLFFLMGAFVCSLLVEFVLPRRRDLSHAV